MLAILSYFIFSVICINYFKGLFFDCEVTCIKKNDLMKSKWDCVDSGGEWIDSHLNFNNIGKAMQTLFMFSTNV
jgi:hypothetical protein